MKLTYIYHSAFCIDTGNVTIIIDFYKDSKDFLEGIVYKEILPNAKKLYVLCTHSHLDHFNGEVFNWTKRVDNITYVLSKEISPENVAKLKDVHYLDKLETYEDENILVRAYGSTDVGGSFYIEVDGKKIFHAGDLNNWHWNEESSPEEIEEAEAFYAKELDILSNDVKVLDVAMFPLDPKLGKDFMKGAQQFVEKIDVKLLAPMHFDEEYKRIKLFDDIAKKNNTEYMLISEKGQSINLK